MNNQPSFDRTLLIPIGVGLFSLLGICLILVGGRFVSSRATVEVVPSATAFQYVFIGTEPVDDELATVGLTEDLLTVEPPPADTADPSDFPTAAVVPTNTLASLITLPPLITPNTPSRTPTSAFAAPFGAGTFDDIDSRFVYNGNWKVIPGTTFETTLHVSDTIGNTVRFLFYGNEVHVFYQVGPSLGTIRLTLDSTTYSPQTLNSTVTSRYEWVLGTSTVGTHTVTITHESGGSVNFDGIIVPAIPVTPTSTTTSTPLNQ